MEITLGRHWSRRARPVTIQMSQDCAVHEHSNWVPTNIHHVWPRGLGGPNTPDNKVVVCMNGHGEIHAYIELLMKYNGKIPNQTRYHFGLKVRNMARKGWDEAGKPTHGGGGE